MIKSRLYNIVDRTPTKLITPKFISKISQANDLKLDVKQFSKNQKEAHVQLLCFIHNTIRHSQLLKQIPERRSCLHCGKNLNFDSRFFASKKKVKINGNVHLEWKLLYCSNRCCLDYIDLKYHINKVMQGKLKGDRNTCDYALFKMIRAVPTKYYMLDIKSNFGTNLFYLAHEVTNILKYNEKNKLDVNTTVYVRKKLNNNVHRLSDEQKRESIPFLLRLLQKGFKCSK